MNSILIAIIVVSVIVTLVVVARKIPQLRVIDISSIAKERERKVKEQLILSKFQRTGGVKLRRISKASSGAVNAVSKSGRRLVQRLYKLEQYYQKLKHATDEGAHAYSDDRIKQRFDEAQDFIKQEEYIPAEKIFIDIISHNPKSVDAYEQLGNMYMLVSQNDQARETLKFALRLSPNDASVNVSLAELEMKEGDAKQALEYLKKALEKRSKNPKYIDFYIEAALQTGSLKDARKGIQSLREVNPENNKIEEFEKRFQEKKEAYINKTSSTTEETSQKE
jgi:tetratricopeptide (TPR) repeat protein